MGRRRQRRANHLKKPKAKRRRILRGNPRKSLKVNRQKSRKEPRERNRNPHHLMNLRNGDDRVEAQLYNIFLSIMVATGGSGHRVMHTGFEPFQ
mmetsp:Transcript_523/g.978  ORF Transcript_523/g.978 Transcript_523/m.978 type:complete len:94 (-) Transcript_523:134-415(-)